MSPATPLTLYSASYPWIVIAEIWRGREAEYRGVAIANFLISHVNHIYFLEFARRDKRKGKTEGSFRCTLVSPKLLILNPGITWRQTRDRLSGLSRRETRQISSHRSDESSCLQRGYTASDIDQFVTRLINSLINCSPRARITCTCVRIRYYTSFIFIALSYYILFFILYAVLRQDASFNRSFI